MRDPRTRARTTSEGSSTNYTRRRFLATSALLAGAAGCIGGDGEEPSDNETDQRPSRARVEDPPAVVYKPSHVESVGMLEPIQAGDFRVLPHYTFPHTFWLMRGDGLKEVPATTDGLHLMFAVWDGETGAMLPVDAGLNISIKRDGELVQAPFPPWPMISQRMGFHFGDNVTFPSTGTYTIEVQLGPIDDRKTGVFADRFTETVSTSFEFEYTEDVQREAAEGIEYLDESKWGEPGAISPMGHGGMGDDDTGSDDSGGGMMSGHPGVGLAPAESYPGQDLGVHESHDAQFVVRYLEDSRLAEDGSYLLVSPRTPYNRVPLPDMSLSVEGAVEGTLGQTLDGEVGHHYGLAATLDSGDTFDLVAETPPQVARHRGYETAFLDMSPVTVEVP
jgi:hypothetical protein